MTNRSTDVVTVVVVFDRIRADFKASCNGEHNPSMSSVGKLLKVINWEVHYGPLPSSIYWWVQNAHRLTSLSLIGSLTDVYKIDLSILE